MNNRHIPLSTEIENRVGPEIADAIYEAFTRGAEQTERQLMLAHHRRCWATLVVREILPLLTATPPAELQHVARLSLRLARWRVFGLEKPETRRERRGSFVYEVLQVWGETREPVTSIIRNLLRCRPDLRPRRKEPYTEENEPRFLKEALKRFERGVQDLLASLGSTPTEQRREAERLLKRIAQLEQQCPAPCLLVRGEWFDRATLEYLLANRL